MGRALLHIFPTQNCHFFSKSQFFALKRNVKHPFLAPNLHFSNEKSTFLMKNWYFFNGRSWRGLGVVWWRRGPARSAPMQRGARFFQKQCFPCSVALVLGSDDTKKIKQTIKLESNMFYNLLEYVENMQGTINETHKQTIKQAKRTTNNQKNTQTFNQTKDQSSKQSIKHTINQIKQSKKE